MPRIARIVVVGQPHHITQRGNNRQDVFFVDEDRLAYLDILKSQSQRYGLTIHGYCLMTNHVHIIATPQGDQSLATAIGRTHYRYTQYVNRLHRRSGHLWQNRFFSCVLDQLHYSRTMAYVERNPVRAKLVRAAWRYAWSSAAAHIDGVDQSGLLTMTGWRKAWPADRWKTVLREGDDEKMTSAIRLHTSRGRPLATDAFLSKLESKLGRRLRPLPVGRPRAQDKRKETRKKSTQAGPTVRKAVNR